MSVRTVVFDFGNVVCTFDRLKAARQLSAFTDRTAEEILPALSDPELEEPFEAGEMSGEQWLGKLRQRFQLRGTDAELTLAACDMFARNPDVCKLVPELARSYRVVLLSNTNELHYRHYRREFADVLDQFHYLVASHEVKVRKPDARIYSEVERLTGSLGAECLFIDDLQVNVDAARARGWQGLVYQLGDDLTWGLSDLGIVLNK